MCKRDPKRQRDKEIQRDKDTKGQRDIGTKIQRDKETKGQRDKDTKGQRYKGTKRQRDKLTNRQRDRQMDRQTDRQNQTASVLTTEDALFTWIRQMVAVVPEEVGSFSCSFLLLNQRANDLFTSKKDFSST